MRRSLQNLAFQAVALAGFGAALAGCTPNQFGLASQQQAFGQRIVYNTKVDVLVVVDNSGSMATKQAQLSQGFGPFIDYLVSGGFDFRIAVTTMDMSGGGASGKFVGSPTVLTSTTPNLRQAFTSNVSQGTNGSDLSRGLQAMYTGLSANLLSGPNSGFWRDDALLALVFLSDEDDASANNSQYYIDALNKAKPVTSSGAQSWVANSIVVTSLTSDCKSLNQYASPGYRYMDLSKASNGAIESICTADLVQASQDIKWRILEILTQYHLQAEPVVSSIQVFINGVPVPQDASNGWTYNPAGYTISFHGSFVPPADANVQVAYQPASANH